MHYLYTITPRTIKALCNKQSISIYIKVCISMLNGTKKDSQERLKMESSRQKETGKAKNHPEKTFEGDLKRCNKHGTAERSNR